MSGVGFRANYVQLIPSAPATIPNGCYFVDSTNGNAATFKDVGGSTIVLTNPAAALVVKQMQVIAGYPANTPVAKRADGKVEIAQADTSDGQVLIGITLAATINPGELVNVLCVGANIAAAIYGLGFVVGDEVYVSETGGYTNDASTLTNSDAIVKVGIADCAAGIASSTATDLILFPDVVSSI